MSLLRKDDQGSTPKAAKKRSKSDSAGAPVPTHGGSVVDLVRAATGGAGVASEAAKQAPDYGFMARPPSIEGLASPPDTTAEEIRRGVAIHESEWRAFSLHLGAEATLRRPTVPPAEPPDPASQRALIENNLGIPELESSLAPFGTPPVAPPAKKVDRYALE